MGFATADVLIVVIYLILSTGAGAWIGRHQQNTTDYFLGGRKIPWPAVAFSIVATETSVLTFISIPAVSYQGNLTFIQIAFGYLVGRLLVARFLLPAYYAGNIKTAYHFLGDRFGQKMRSVTSVTFMVTRLLADGVRLFATAIPLAVIFKSSGFLQGTSDAELYAWSICFIGVVTILYTYIGGIRSVIWMDVVQMSIYITGALLAAFLILSRLSGDGGIWNSGELVAKLKWFDLGAGLSLQEFVRQPYTFVTALVAGAIFSVASHGTDQLIVQRVLTCKDLRSSQRAMATSGVAVLLQFALFLWLGILLFAYYDGRTVAELGLARADGIFPKFIVEEMPVGVSGLIVAALFAAAMSTLSSSLSSLSSAVVFDIYVPLFGKNKTEKQLLTVSRFVTLAWGLILTGTALTFIGLQGTVVEVALGIASYTYGGLLGAFMLGLFFPHVRQRDAIVGFFSGLATMAVVITAVQIAWPLYTVVGAVAAICCGWLSRKILG